MVTRILGVVATLLLMAACQSTPKDSAFSNDGGNYEGIDAYHMASQNLEPFTPIPGDETGAKASDRVFFAFDSAVLSSQAQRTLDRQSDWLKKNSKIDITVEGHCDERGTREYNLALGERRASAVKNYLINSGISSSRISTLSYGKERPAVLGSNSNAWSQNRRSVTILDR